MHKKKEYLENNKVLVIQIVTCFEEQYGALFHDIDNLSAENIMREPIEGWLNVV